MDEEDRRKKRRAQWVNMFLASLITETFENAFYEGKITQEERDRYYHRIGTRCNMVWLLPNKKSKKEPEPPKKKRRSLLDIHLKRG